MFEKELNRTLGTTAANGYKVNVNNLAARGF